MTLSFHDAVIIAQAEKRTMVITTSAIREYRLRFHDGLAIVETRVLIIGGGWGSWSISYGIPASALTALRWGIE